jgi:hypothetical protein
MEPQGSAAVFMKRAEWRIRPDTAFRKESAMNMIFLSTLALGTLTGAALAEPTCRNFEATILLHMVKEGCTSPVGICTKGMVVSNDPSLTGATWSFTASGTAASAGLPAALQPPSMLSYAGTVVVTTLQDGTFTTSNAGVFDTAAGAFSQLDQITSGTEKFGGSTGRLIFTSGIGSGDAGFKCNVRGELCLSP